MSRTLHGSRLRPSSIGLRWLLSCSCGLLFLGATSCKTSQVFRLNPGEEPERYRVVCRDSSKVCEREAKDVCDGEYTVLGREQSREELPEVKDSDLSSSGPSEGLVGWRGELVVTCGRELPPLRLTRPPGERAAASGSASSALPPPVPVLERVCIPGETQACLGPGACSGAQACLRDGSGFGPCDCGPAPVTPTVSENPGATPSVAPAQTGATGAPSSAPPSGGSK